MALVWCDGFEGYGSVNNAAPAPSGVFADKYLYANDESQWRMLNAAGFVVTDWGLQFSNAIYNMVLTTKDVISGGTAVAGVAVEQWDWDDFASGFSWPIICFKNSAANLCLSLVCEQGCFYVRDASSTYVAGIPIMLRIQEHNYIEMKAESGTTANVEVRINGATVFQGTVNTSNTGGAITRVGLGDLGQGYPMEYAHLDNFYVCDGTGNTNNDFLGDVDVKTLWPDADSATAFTGTGNANYATNYQQVFREQRDGSTDYVIENTVGYQDLYSVDGLADSGDIHAVMVWGAVSYVTDARNAKLLCKSGTTTSNGGTVNVTTDVLIHGAVFETDPDTGNSWNQTTVNAATFGIEVAS